MIFAPSGRSRIVRTVSPTMAPERTSAEISSHVATTVVVTAVPLNVCT